MIAPIGEAKGELVDDPGSAQATLMGDRKEDSQADDSD